VCVCVCARACVTTCGTAEDKLMLIRAMVQGEPSFISRGIKRPGREDNSLVLFNAKVKNEWRYTSQSPYHFVAYTVRVLTLNEEKS